ncbi:MAG: hypothetical protein BRD21_09845 [Halobacteriales archaeon SW_8_66_22]|nr:MAG: hypothetical protein BRD21_09845 [Halobacteriales archaeon SW_8_66_22]
MTQPPSGPRRSTRLVLLLGILSGISGLMVLPFTSPEQFMLASDVYRHAAEAMLAGEDFYAVSPPRLPGYNFIYPPIVILLFVPHALVGSALGAYAIQLLLTVAFGLGTTLVVGRALARRGVALSRIDWLLIGSFTLVSAHSAITLANGQVTIWMGFAFALGFDALDRSRETVAGVAFALAALIKVFPAAVGLWLLRRRAWRSVIVATATGLGGLALGAVLFGPDVTETYVRDVLLGRYEGETFGGVPEPDQTTGGAQRQLAALTGLGSPALGILALAIVGPAVLALHRRIDTDERRLAAMLGTVLGVLLVLLYTLPSGRGRRLLLLGTLVSSVRVTYDLAASTVETMPLPGALSEPLLSLIEMLFVFVLPTTLGLWLLLAGCLFVQFGSEGGPARSTVILVAVRT